MPPITPVQSEDSLSKDGERNIQADIRKYLQLPLGDETMSFAGLVEDNSGIISRSGVSEPSISTRECTENRKRPTMATLLRTDADGYKLLAKEIETMGSGFLDYFSGETISLTSRYISDVFLYKGTRRLAAVVERLRRYGESRRVGMFGYSVEDDHIHIIHDCSYSGNSCRCSWKEKIRPFGNFGPDRKYNKPVWKFTRTDWFDVFVYFFLKKRGARQIWFRGKSWSPPTDAQLVRWEEIIDSRPQVVRGSDSESDSQCTEQGHKRSRRAVNNDDNNAIYGKKAKTRGVFEYIFKKTKELLTTHLIAPPEDILNIPEFRSDLTLINPKNKLFVTAALNDFALDIQRLTLGQLETMIGDKKPLFNIGLNYIDEQKSLLWLDELLRFQCGDDDDAINLFLTKLVTVINRKQDKLNTFIIVSPANAGKNFFIEPLLSVCYSYGRINDIINKNSGGFEFMDCVNKRLIYWNEPNYCPSRTNFLKEVCEAGPFKVKVKFQGDANVKPTPVIVTTNDWVPFMTDPTFRTRIFVSKWDAAPHLEYLKGKPYPLAIFALLKKYNIDYQ